MIRKLLSLIGHRVVAAVGERSSEADNLVRLPAPEPGDSASPAESIPRNSEQPARVLSILEWRKKMGKDSNDTPKDTKNYQEMTGREMLLKIMELTAAKDITDYELQEILEAIERILSERKDPGKQ